VVSTAKPEKIKGVWWLPEKPELRVVGEFQTEDERASLNLIGHFFSLGDDFGPAKFTVWGVSVSGTPFTLLECFVSNSSFHLSGGLPTAEISPNLWLSGGHFHRLEDVTLTKLHCDLTYLVYWVGYGSYSIHYDPQLATFRLEGKRSDAIRCADIDGVAVQLSPALVISPTDVSMTFRNECHLFLESDTPHTYESLEFLLTGMAQLLALAAERPIYFTKIVGLRPADSTGTQQKVEIFRRVRMRADAEKTLRRDQMLFTWEDVQALGPDFIAKFFARREQFRPSLEVLLSDRYNAEAYQHQRFLGLAHGLEAFHRVFVGGKYQTDENYRADLEPRLAAAIPADLHSDFRRSLKNKLKYLHEFSLRKRITDLALKFDAIIRDVIRDPRAFAAAVAEERNRLSHPDQSSSLDGSSGRDLWLMAEQMSLLLELCLVRELGFGDGVLNKIVSDGRHAHAIKLNLPAPPAPPGSAPGTAPPS
jgi:hypothetical protein